MLQMPACGIATFGLTNQHGWHARAAQLKQQPQQSSPTNIAGAGTGLGMVLVWLVAPMAATSTVLAAQAATAAVIADAQRKPPQPPPLPALWPLAYRPLAWQAMLDA